MKKAEKYLFGAALAIWVYNIWKGKQIAAPLGNDATTATTLNDATR